MLNTPRYGRKNRLNYRKVQEKTKALYECPKCGKKKLKRVSFALFVCKSCGAKVAGGAYEPTTGPGRTALRIILTLKEGGENA